MTQSSITSGSVPSSSSALLEDATARHAREAALFKRFRAVFSRALLPSQARDARQRWTSAHLPTLNQLRSDGVNGEIAGHDGRLRSLYWKLYFDHLPLLHESKDGGPLSPDPQTPPAAAAATAAWYSDAHTAAILTPAASGRTSSPFDDAPSPSPSPVGTFFPASSSSSSIVGSPEARLSSEYRARKPGQGRRDRAHLLSAWQRQWLATVGKERAHYAQLRKAFLSNPGASHGDAEDDDAGSAPATREAGPNAPAGAPPRNASKGPVFPGDVGLHPRSPHPETLDGLPAQVRAQAPARGASLSPSSSSGAVSVGAADADLSINNPLSLASSNPWKRHFASLELLATIEADVRRTFPDVPLFGAGAGDEEDDADDAGASSVGLAAGVGAGAGAASSERAVRAAVRKGLTNALFVWCCIHQDVGYRQGMHELAASCYYARWRDRMRAGASSGAAQPAHDSGDAGEDGGGDEAARRLAAEKDAAAEEFLRTMLDEQYVEHDAYALFNSLMLGAKSWYDWRVPGAHDGASGGSGGEPGADAAAAAPSVLATSSAPIVQKAERIFELLRHVDPALASHLSELGIEPQLFALRWVRLLFTREFPLDEALEMWDGTLAYDGLLEDIEGASGVGGRADQAQGQSGGQAHAGKRSLILVDYVCAAMLLRIRAHLLSGGYSTALQNLLRYPPLPARTPGRNDEEGRGQHTGLLVRQAITLRTSPNPTTGVQVVIQNRDKLGIDMVVEPAQDDASPTPNQLRRGAAPQPRGHRARPSAAQTVATGRSSGQRPGLVAGMFGGPPRAQEAPAASGAGAQQAQSGVAFPFSPTAYLPEGISDLAKGLYEKSDALGINRAVGNAMSNVNRAVNAYTAAGAGRAAGQRFNSNDGFPDVSADAITARRINAMARVSPPAGTAAQGSPSAQASAAEQLAALQEANRTMGVAIASCVETLEQRWKSGPALTPAAEGGSSDNLTENDIATLMSITALKHIRDVLLGNAREYDPAILGSAAAAPAAAPAPAPAQPARAPPPALPKRPSTSPGEAPTSVVKPTPRTASRPSEPGLPAGTPATGLPRVPILPRTSSSRQQPPPRSPVAASSGSPSLTPASASDPGPLSSPDVPSTAASFATARSPSPLVSGSQTPTLNIGPLGRTPAPQVRPVEPSSKMSDPLGVM